MIFIWTSVFAFVNIVWITFFIYKFVYWNEIVAGWVLALSITVIGIIVKRGALGHSIVRFFGLSFGANFVKVVVFFILFAAIIKSGYVIQTPFIFSFFIAYFTYLVYDVVSLTRQKEKGR